MAQNFRVPLGLFTSTSNPTNPTPVAGDMYYNTTANEVRVYDGASWVALGGGGGAADAGTLTGTTLASNVINSSLTSFGSSPTITTPALSLSTTTDNAIGRIAWDNTNSQIEIGNGSGVKVFTADDATATLTNKTISGANNTVSTTGTLTIGTGLSGTSFNGSSNVTISIDSTVTTLTGSQTLTNKTLQGATLNNSAVTLSQVPTTGIDNTGQVNNLQVIQSTNAAGADSFITFHNSGTYAVHFGLNRATNRLAWGGWSAGAVKYTIYSSADLLPNSALQNSSITINGTAVSLGGSATIGASAATVTTLGTVYGYTNNTVTRTALGFNALLSSSGTDNTAVGFNATANQSTGARNTAIGLQAGYLSNTGNDNVYVGRHAGFNGSGPTASNNVFIGQEAGYFAGLNTVSGLYTTAASIAIGYQAAYSTRGAVSGLYPGGFTIIGYQAGALGGSNFDGNHRENAVIGGRASYNRGSDRCVIIGSQAGGSPSLSFVNPGNDVIIGYQAGYNPSSSGSNIIIGANALRGISTGPAYGGAIVIGGNAGGNNYNGNSNVIIGTGAGNGITTGAINTIIGPSASSNATTRLTTGSNNIIIGNSAEATAATVSNTITLGNASITVLRCQVTTITALSDIRDKTNVIEMPVGLNLIDALRPVVFEWNIRPQYDSEGNEIENANNGTRQGGFIAQDLDEVETTFDVADWLGLVYKVNPDRLEASPGKLLPIMVKAIQELSAKVKQLETQLEAK